MQIVYCLSSTVDAHSVRQHARAVRNSARTERSSRPPTRTSTTCCAPATTRPLHTRRLPLQRVEPFLRQHALVAAVRGAQAPWSRPTSVWAAAPTPDYSPTTNVARRPSLTAQRQRLVLPGLRMLQQPRPMLKPAGLRRPLEIDAPGGPNKALPLELGVVGTAAGALPSFAYAPSNPMGKPVLGRDGDPGAQHAGRRAADASQLGQHSRHAEERLGAKLRQSAADHRHELRVGAARHILESESDFQLRLRAPWRRSGLRRRQRRCGAAAAGQPHPNSGAHRCRVRARSTGTTAKQAHLSRRLDARDAQRQRTLQLALRVPRRQHRARPRHHQQRRPHHGRRRLPNTGPVRRNLPASQCQREPLEPLRQLLRRLALQRLLRPHGHRRPSVSDPWIGSTPGDFRFCPTKDSHAEPQRPSFALPRSKTHRR